jgi:hypothetical protein
MQSESRPVATAMDLIIRESPIWWSYRIHPLRLVCDTDDYVDNGRRSFVTQIWRTSKSEAVPLVTAMNKAKFGCRSECVCDILGRVGFHTLYINMVFVPCQSPSILPLLSS